MSISVPTDADDLRILGRTLRLVLTMPLYATIAVIGSFVFLTVMAVREHWSLFNQHILGSTPLPPAAQVELFLGFYPLYGGGFDFGVAISLVVIALLTGVNVALLTYHVREYDLSASGGGGSAFGVAIGVLGAGCAACGSTLLLGILTLVGAGGILSVLPYHGLEFTFLAIPVLLLSSYWIADGMRGGEVNGCPIDARQ